MHTTLRSRILFTAVATLAFAAAPVRAADAPAAPANYTVNLSPAIKVGQKFGTVADLSSNNSAVVTISAPALPTPQTQNQKQLIIAHVEADGEVLAVFPNGTAKKVSLAITSINGTMDGKPLPALPAVGAKVVIEKDDANKETVTVDGKPSEGPINEVLSGATVMGSAKFNFQDAFGPKGPVPTGASWPVNTDGFLAMQRDFPGADKVAGDMKLDGVTGTGDDQVVAVSGKIDVSGIKLPLPPTMPMKSAEMTTQITASIPATTTKGVRNETVTNKMSAVADGSPDGTMQVKMNVSGEEKRTLKTTYR